ncbi:MarR family winged helix-turn-helix transcriptional regulator [Variovorax sp. J2P1-59]|uniref:MarR family winged helix-turn-helix transcriptional regulator n=1 Tax=Variovorax flavidus TaxID=3053501 RepID=UPI00257899EB|nr:MarR family winged helix-turn-helix transcriptional regulator [Variovorax sp. J2P1-59]MDM0078587.1 MarR family winged helix-turn-helix transcriptional regulator [Variovorax sp. J2P1-59]
MRTIMLPPELSRAKALQANKLGALWAVVGRAMTATMETHSESSAAILLWLYYWAPTGVVELGRVVGLSQPACSRAVDKLMAAGLLLKARSGARETWLDLSPAGRVEAERLQSARLHACDRLLGTLSRQERATMVGLLDKLLAAPVDSRAYARNVCRFCDHAICDGPACPVGCRATEIEGEVAADDAR